MPITGGLIGGGISILGGLLGSNAASKAQARAAAEQNRLSNLALDLQEQMYNEQQAQFAPYAEFGLGGVQGMQQDLAGTYDYTQTPEYQFRQNIGTNALKGVLGDRYGQYAGDAFTTGLNLDENAQSYGRLLDRVKVGQGAAGSAGQSALGYGNALANAYQSQAAANQIANMNAGNIRFNALGQAAEQASSIPAYIQQANYLRSLNQMGY